MSAPAAPRDEVRGTARTLHVAAVRAGAAGAGLVALAAEVAGRLDVVANAPALVATVAAGALLLTVARRPGSAAVGAVGALVVLLQLLVGDLDARAVIAALGVHAMLLLTGLTALLPGDSEVEVAVLAPTARRFVPVAALTAAVAVASALVRRLPVLGEGDLLVLGLAAVAGVASVAVVVGRRSAP